MRLDTLGTHVLLGLALMLGAHGAQAADPPQPQRAISW